MRKAKFSKKYTYSNHDLQKPRNKKEKEIEKLSQNSLNMNSVIPFFSIILGKGGIYFTFFFNKFSRYEKNLFYLKMKNLGVMTILLFLFYFLYYIQNIIIILKILCLL